MYLELVDIIAIITTVLLLAFALFLVILKRRNSADILLALFIFSNALYILGFLYWRLHQYMPGQIEYVLFIAESCGYIFGPLLYFYTKTLVFKDFSLNKKHLIHFIPFIVALLYYYSKINTYIIPVYLLMQIQIFAYIICCLLLIKQHHKELKKYYSSLEKLHLYRLEITLFTFTLMWLVDLAGFFLLIFIPDGTGYYNFTLIISLSINFIFAILIFYNGMQHPQVLLRQNGNFEKYEKSKLTNQKKEEYLSKLRLYIEQEKPFLKPSVTLNDFARHLNIPVRDLSQVINEYLHKNFYDLINSYRIEEAKNLLKTSSNSTILEILFEVGFNSKSAFNTAFKKHTGFTPTRYRNKLIADPL